MGNITQLPLHTQETILKAIELTKENYKIF